MRTATKQRRVSMDRRRSDRRKKEKANSASQFLKRTFYYLKAEQFLKMSNRLLCETA